MKCRQCGIEIADKALICYKCGTPTTEAKYQPVPLQNRPSCWRPALLVPAVVIVVALLLFAGYAMLH
jgi:uncharacterized membrane protein YvbJ